MKQKELVPLHFQCSPEVANLSLISGNKGPQVKPCEQLSWVTLLKGKSLRLAPQFSSDTIPRVTTSKRTHELGALSSSFPFALFTPLQPYTLKFLKKEAEAHG